MNSSSRTTDSLNQVRGLPALLVMYGSSVMTMALRVLVLLLLAPELLEMSSM